MRQLGLRSLSSLGHILLCLSLQNNVTCLFWALFPLDPALTEWQFQNTLYFKNNSLQYMQAGEAASSLFTTSSQLPDWESPSLKPMKVSSSVTRVPVRLQCVKPSRRRGQWDMGVIRAGLQLSLCAWEKPNSTFASAQNSSVPWAALSLLLDAQSPWARGSFWNDKDDSMWQIM